MRLILIHQSIGGWKAESIAESTSSLCPKRIEYIFVKNTETCPQHGFDPGTSRAADKHATTRPLGPAYIGLMLDANELPLLRA